MCYIQIGKGVGLMDRIQWEKFKREYLPLENGQGRENYLFKKQLEKLERLLKNTREEENDEFNKVIGISGERGSGKSSLLWSFKNILDKEVEERRYYALNPIDPNYLDKNMGLLEIILTTLYNEVEKHIKKNKDCDLQQAKQVKDSILRQIELQTNMRQSKGFSSKATPSELIEEYKSRVSFQEEYHALFKKCWSLLVGMSCENYKRGYLVILIDDIDIVNNDLIYDMLEDIKMVLSENTTTVLTYRKTQLESSLYNVKIEENRELIDNFSLVDREEVIKQGDTYLEKLIAQNNTVKMETDKGILERPLQDLFTNQKDREYLTERGMDINLSVRNNIYEFIEQNILISIESRDYRELENFESSFNLRSIIQLFEMMMEEFKDLSEVNEEEKFAECLKNNISVVREYLLGKGTDILTNERLNMIIRWNKAASKNKNYLLYSYISQQIYEKTKENNSESPSARETYDKMLNMKSVQYYNICLGDVMEALSYEKMFIQDYTFHFYIKVFYSMELLTSLVEEIYQVTSSGLKLRFNFKNELSNDGERLEGNVYFTSDKSKENAFYKTTYYQLTRYKILPFNKYVLPSKLKTSWKYYTENAKCPTLIEKVTYTLLSEDGRQLPGARKKNSADFELHDAYKYRSVFMPSFYTDTKTYTAEGDIEQENYRTIVSMKSSFKIDPFAVLTKEWYLNELLNSTNEVENLTPPYLFYSLFDIDIFERVNMNPDKGKDFKYIVRHVLRKVNSTVSSIVNVEKYNNLGKYRFRNKVNEDRNYTIYTEKEIGTSDDNGCSRYLIGNVKENPFEKYEILNIDEIKEKIIKNRFHADDYTLLQNFTNHYIDKLTEKEQNRIKIIKDLKSSNHKRELKDYAEKIIAQLEKEEH